VVRETSCRVPRVDRYPRAVETRSRPRGEGLRCLWGTAPSIQGAGRFRAPDAFIADGAISASLRCPTQAKGWVWSSTRAMGDRETAVVRETSCRVPRVDRYPRAVETRSRPSGEGLRCLWGTAPSIQGAGRLRAPDAQGAGRLRDPRCPLC